mmetsp:Transcript_91098/g.236175  ORF Transcript_91098/g.236175 Transcript_91098/m.236175 type:complete len:203 (-) Transcript_91098:261-869(-)
MAHLAAPPTSPRRLRNRTRAVSLQAPELPLKHAHFDAGATACLAFHLAALLPPLDAHLPGTHCRHAKRALLKAPELLHERLRVGAAPHYALVPDSPLLLLLLLILPSSLPVLAHNLHAPRLALPATLSRLVCANPQGICLRPTELLQMLAVDAHLEVPQIRQHVIEAHVGISMNICCDGHPPCIAQVGEGACALRAMSSRHV